MFKEVRIPDLYLIGIGNGALIEDLLMLMFMHYLNIFQKHGTGEYGRRKVTHKFLRLCFIWVADYWFMNWIKYSVSAVMDADVGFVLFGCVYCVLCSGGVCCFPLWDISWSVICGWFNVYVVVICMCCAVRWWWVSKP